MVESVTDTYTMEEVGNLSTEYKELKPHTFIMHAVISLYFTQICETDQESKNPYTKLKFKYGAVWNFKH